MYLAHKSLLPANVIINLNSDNRFRDFSLILQPNEKEKGITIKPLEKNEGKTEESKEDKTIQKKIYIRIPKDKLDLEDRVIAYIKDLAKEQPGKVPVYIFYDGTNKLRLLGSQDFLNDSSVVIEKLELAFGKENVKVK